MIKTNSIFFKDYPSSFDLQMDMMNMLSAMSNGQQSGAPNYTFNALNPAYGATNSTNRTTNLPFRASNYPKSAFNSTQAALLYGTNSGSRYTNGIGLPANGLYRSLAETSMKSSLRSIETVIETVVSISNLMQASFSLVTDSIRTITTVADGLLDVKNKFGELSLCSSLVQTIFGFIQWILKALGLGNSILYQKLDKQWENAFISAEGSHALNQAMRNMISKSTDKPFVPVAYFLALLLGLPLIAMRLLGGSSAKPPAKGWWTKDGDHYRGIVLKNYSDQKVNLKKDDHVLVHSTSVQPGTEHLMVYTLTEKPQVVWLPAQIVRIVFD